MRLNKHILIINRQAGGNYKNTKCSCLLILSIRYEQQYERPTL